MGSCDVHGNVWGICPIKTTRLELVDCAGIECCDSRNSGQGLPSVESASRRDPCGMEVLAATVGSRVAERCCCAGEPAKVWISLCSELGRVFFNVKIDEQSVSKKGFFARHVVWLKREDKAGWLSSRNARYQRELLLAGKSSGVKTSEKWNLRLQVCRKRQINGREASLSRFPLINYGVRVKFLPVRKPTKAKWIWYRCWCLGWCPVRLGRCWCCWCSTTPSCGTSGCRSWPRSSRSSAAGRRTANRTSCPV